MNKQTPNNTFEGLTRSVFVESIRNTLANRNTVTVVNKLTNTVTDTVAKKSEREVDAIADRIMLRLNNPSRRAFYCKVAWYLPEHKIWSNLELATEKGKDPQKYFTWLCNKDLNV